MRATKPSEYKRTAQQWAAVAGVQVAINGDFFDLGGTYATWGAPAALAWTLRLQRPPISWAATSC